MTKKRILLVNYIGYPQFLLSYMPDNDLAVLSKALLHNGHDVEIQDFANLNVAERIALKVKVLTGTPSDIAIPYKDTDFNHLINLNTAFQKALNIIEDDLLNDIIKIVMKKNINIIGFKLWPGRSTNSIIKWLAKIKIACPNLIIFCMGSPINILRKKFLEILDTKNIDIIFAGENIEPIISYVNEERYACKYVESDTALEEYCGIYTSDIYPSLDKENKLNIFTIQESVGCNNKCAFCRRPWLYQKRIIAKAANVWKQVDEMQSLYKTNIFRFNGSNTPVKLLEELAKTKGNRKCYFWGFGEFNEYINDENVENAYKAGVRWIFFGLESASEMLLKKSYNKYFSPQKAKSVIKKCRQLGIRTSVSLIYPNPFETDQTRDETLRWINEAQPDSIMINLPSVLFGSRWYHQPSKYGFSTNESKLDLDHHEGFYLPYGVGLDDVKPSDIFLKLEDFLKRLDNNIVFCTEDYLAFADILNIQDTKQFSLKVQEAIYGGNITEIRKIFRTINRKLGGEYEK